MFDIGSKKIWFYIFKENVVVIFVLKEIMVTQRERLRFKSADIFFKYFFLLPKVMSIFLLLIFLVDSRRLWK